MARYSKLSKFILGLATICHTGVSYLEATSASTVASLSSRSFIDNFPLKLVSADRADIMAYYLYAKYREWNVRGHFANALYETLLEQQLNAEAQSNPRCFEALLDTLKEHRFNFESLEERALSSGALLAAGCLLYDIPLSPAFAETLSFFPGQDFCSLQNRQVEEKYLDAMALEYCQLRPDSFVMILYPRTSHLYLDIEPLISQHAEIIYKKEMTLSRQGGLNLLLQAYEDNGWSIERARQKARRCFPADRDSISPIRVYLLQASSLTTMVECKERIRALCQINHNSVHCTDTHEQAIILARALFNPNAPSFLNYRKILGAARFERSISQFRDYVDRSQQPNEWFCLSGDMVFAAFGLKPVGHFEYIQWQNEHHSLPQTLPSDFLFEPENYIYYKGIKILSLEALRTFLIAQDPIGNARDIALIESALADFP